jgi:hypothetical protein
LRILRIQSPLPFGQEIVRVGVDKFICTVRLYLCDQRCRKTYCASGDLEHFAVLQADSFRVKLIAKVASFEEDVEFTLVDPRYPSVMTRDIQKATVSILFFKRVVTADVQRTNLMHVANYDERFGAKLGPIRTLNF